MSTIWSRRRFLSNAALTAAASQELFATPRLASRSYLAFIGVAPAARPDLHHIETYRVEEGRWLSTNSVVHAASPQALVVHPRLPVLYAAHCTKLYRHLPRGSVSAYGFDPRTGILKLLGREPLALSATEPDHIAVSPDGRLLLIAASTGGAWNFLSLAADGSILPMPTSLKLTGYGAHPLQGVARPHSAVFHRSAPTVYATDFSSDRVDQISLESCNLRPDAGFITPRFAKRISVPAGSGPAHLVMHPSGRFVAMVNDLCRALTVFEVEANGGISNSPLYSVPLDVDAIGPLVRSHFRDVHSGVQLYLATAQSTRGSRVDVYAWSSGTGKLRQTGQLDLAWESLPRRMIATTDELLMPLSKGIGSAALNIRSGENVSKLVVRSRDAVSIAVYPPSV
jgi:6-phosphogluconolactonase (cycloisomerase 2 family)